VEGAGIVLGKFSTSSDGVAQGLELRRNPQRQEGPRYELVTNIEGDNCEKSVQRWVITGSAPGKQEIVAVGSSFNPTTAAFNVSGYLSQPESNIDGCSMFTESLEGIVLIKRGNCWFHTKAVNAQAAGAAAVIVYNDKAQMVDIMEGVDELPSLMIPTVLVDGPAFESVKQMVGTPISMTKRGFDGEDIHRLPCLASSSNHPPLSTARPLPPKNT
jgi:hypothetical protein